MILAEATGSATRNQGRYRYNGSVQLDLACLHQLHDRQSGKGLGERAEDKGRLRRDRAAGVIGRPEALQVDDLVSLHDAKGETRDAGCVQLGLDVASIVAKSELPVLDAAWTGCIKGRSARAATSAPSNNTVRIRRVFMMTFLQRYWGGPCTCGDRPQTRALPPTPSEARH